MERRILAVNVSSVPQVFESFAGYEGELSHIEKPATRRINRYWDSFINNKSGEWGNLRHWDHTLNPRGTVAATGRRYNFKGI